MDALFWTLLGGFITWIAAYYYYKKAGDELKQESARLRRMMNNIMVAIFSEKDKIKLGYDKESDIFNLTFLLEPDSLTTQAPIAGSPGITSQQ